MQKCLHSQKKKNMGALIGKMLLTVVCISFICVELGGIVKDKTTHSLKNVKYLDDCDNSMEGNIYPKGAAVSTDDKKMNNLELNNSKNEILKGGKSITTMCVNDINILDKNGNKVKMQLEEYVLGCLIGEMPLSFHPQALMAQCVAIRSFTVNKLVEGSKHGTSLACMNPACCQNYMTPSQSGYSEEYLHLAKAAVNATRNVVATWENIPINAVYHAGSSDRTKDSSEVWYGKVEYLKSVKSPEGEDKVCLANYSGSAGHGVGMSQQGANILANRGYSYADILKYYYTGIGLDIINSGDSV